MKRSKLTEHRARNLALPKSGQSLTFCSEVKGFGVRCTPGARASIVQLRYNGRKVRITLGPIGTLPFEGPADVPGARDLAIAAAQRGAARRGPAPRIGQRRQPAGLTLAQVWGAYQEAGFPRIDDRGHKQATTRAASHSVPATFRPSRSTLKSSTRLILSLAQPTGPAA